ncbi:S-layer homology domain-containing protein [Bacillus sp. NPDC094106]|uniref:S-layer homology domain-containing protein n=1 Tax=Bacillus sp. NPDC094106 TaxID=3363949 RepID=UPI0038065803
MKNTKLAMAGIIALTSLALPTSSFAELENQTQEKIAQNETKYTPNFNDVPEWAKESVNYLVNKNVLTGMPDGTFSPNLEIDRGSAVTMMAKILNLNIEPSAKPSFTDSQNHWATPYIAAAEKAGVIKGDGSGKFNPSGKLTRASMASMLVHAYKLEDKIHGNVPTVFSDLKGHWGEKQVNILVGLGISKGYGDNSWKPDQTVTRVESASLIARTDMSKDKEVQLKQIEMPENFFTYNEPSLSSGIAYEYEPQPVTVFEEREDGWIKIQTGLGFKWVCLNEKKIDIDKKFFTYNAPSLSSGIAYEYEPQPVTVYEEREGGWIRISTGLGLKWVCLNEKKIDIDRSFITYNEPSLSSGIAYEYEPQPVTVIEEREGGWIRIPTGLGYKWVLLNEKRVDIDRDFTTYDDASFSANVLGGYSPQTVTVIEERGTWLRIRTQGGFQWMNTQEPRTIVDTFKTIQNNQQVILVTTNGYGTNNAQIRTFDKNNSKWKEIKNINGKIGRDGFANQMSETVTQSPRGKYGIGMAFGRQGNPGTKLPWHDIQSNDVWVDDSNSELYNTLQKKPAYGRWNSAENMNVSAYDYGFVINYNTDERTPGAGSAIFFHVSNTWTAGCTGASKQDVIDILRWIDPDKNPVIIQAPESELSNY